jgi:hypothetical protein
MGKCLSCSAAGEQPHDIEQTPPRSTKCKLSIQCGFLTFAIYFQDILLTLLKLFAQSRNFEAFCLNIQDL